MTRVSNKSSDDSKMAQLNPLAVVICGEKRNFYSYNEELYTITFPMEWAKTHLCGTGPNECSQCNNVGSWNGVFIGYCGQCAKKYNYARGQGFVYIGKECNSLHPASAANTYLKDVALTDIGDVDFCDSMSMVIPGEYEYTSGARLQSSIIHNDANRHSWNMDNLLGLGNDPDYNYNYNN